MKKSWKLQKVQKNKKGQWKKKVRMKKEFYGARGIGVEVWKKLSKKLFRQQKTEISWTDQGNKLLARFYTVYKNST